MGDLILSSNQFLENANKTVGNSAVVMANQNGTVAETHYTVRGQILLLIQDRNKGPMIAKGFDSEEKADEYLTYSLVREHPDADYWMIPGIMNLVPSAQVITNPSLIV